MFQKRCRQRTMFEVAFLVPSEKRVRLEASWAQGFQEKALPIIEEDAFRELYCEDNGAPNKAVQIVLGALLLKEMSNLTDEETVARVEFDLRWQHALRLTPEEAHVSSKTLYNFRMRLVKSDGGRKAFESVCSGVLRALGVSVARQRLDSTHVCSNVARVSRLGLFCETLRLFLREVREEDRAAFDKLSKALTGRYLKPEASEETATKFEDARSSESRRRLTVCARDLFRLVSHFRDTSWARQPSYLRLVRLMEEQCEPERTKPEAATSAKGGGRRGPREAPAVVSDDEEQDEGDDDPTDGTGLEAPVRPKEPKDVSSGSMQTPHDEDVTYSGHKGKGFEVQIAETTCEGNAVEVITHVEVTPSCASDAHQLLPTLDSLAARSLQPSEIIADAGYGSAQNGLEAQRRGVELVAPVPGGDKDVSIPPGAPFTAVDFEIDPTMALPARCPIDTTSTRQVLDDKGAVLTAFFPASACASCPLLRHCAVRPAHGEYVLRVPLEKTLRDQRRLQQTTSTYRKRYRKRAGIEATNSELKRRYGLGRLRVRGLDRVRVAVYLKAMACNIARMLRAAC